jgi:multidrug efflux pump subunit AcrA (membrane-fusion protein)
MKRKVWIQVSGTTALVVAAAGVVVHMLAGTSSEVQASNGSDNRAGSGEPVRVEVTQAQHRALTETLQLPASLEPGEVADLYAKVSGYVRSLRVDIGSRVQKGDVLLEINVPEMHDELRQAEAVLAANRAKVQALRAKVAQAASMIVTAKAEVQRSEAQLALVRITVDRKKQLFSAMAIPEQDLDEATSRVAVVEAEAKNAKAKVAAADAERDAVEADVQVAQAQVAVEEANVGRLRTLMEYATIRAPFEGVITARLVDPGAFVRSAAEGATTSLLTIARVDYVRLVLNVPESDAPYVNIGTELEANARCLGSTRCGSPLPAPPCRSAKARGPCAPKPISRTPMGGSSPDFTPEPPSC